MPVNEGPMELPAPPAIVQPTQALADILVAYGQFEECGRGRLKAAKLIGKLLCEQKERTPHGEWIPWVEANCSFGRKRAALFMQVHRERDKCRGAVTFEEAVEMVRHLPEPDDVLKDAEKRRGILIDLIGVVDPGMKKKLLDGGLDFTDEQLEKTVPPHCGKCDRMGPPSGRPCETCAAIRKQEQAALFTDEQEPEDEDDPTSPPKPPPDPFGDLQGLTTKLATQYTKRINEHGPEAERLRKYLSWCGLIDHPPNGSTPKFLPLAGVKKIVELASRSESFSQEVVRQEYEKACGAVPWVPPATQYRRARKARK